MTAVILNDGDLRLRRLRDEPADYACLAAWLSDPRVLEFYEGRDHPYNYQMAAEEFNPERMAADGETACIIELAGRPVGYLQFYPTGQDERGEYGLPPGEIIYGLDLFIGEPGLWGSGLGRRVIKALLAYLFKERAAQRVVIDPHVDNLRAIRSYEACGFRKVKVLPAHEWHEGRQVDSWLMEICAPAA